jgi:hypothetical protein
MLSEIREIKYAYSTVFTLLRTVFDMVFTLFERFRKVFGDGLASYRDGFGAEVLRSDRLQGTDFPIIWPYLPPSGIFFGLASPLLMPLKATSAIADQLSSALAGCESPQAPTVSAWPRWWSRPA